MPSPALYGRWHVGRGVGIGVGREFADAGGKEAFRAAVAFEFDLFSVAEALEAVAFNHGKMHEDVEAVSVNDEAEPFSGVKPFDSSDRHSRHLGPTDAGFAEGLQTRHVGPHTCLANTQNDGPGKQLFTGQTRVELDQGRAT